MHIPDIQPRSKYACKMHKNGRKRTKSKLHTDEKLLQKDVHPQKRTHKMNSKDEFTVRRPKESEKVQTKGYKSLQRLIKHTCKDTQR